MRRAVATVILVAAFGFAPAAQKLADESSRVKAIELYRLGQDHMSRERFAEAEASFMDAVDEDPLLTVAHYQLGQARMSLRRYAEAVRAYEACVKAMETLHHLQQTNKFEVDKQRQETIRELRTELNSTTQKIDPLKRTVLEQRVHELEQERTMDSTSFRPPAFVLLALGSAHFRNGAREAAEAEWLAAVEADSKLGEAHNNLAVVYMMSSRKADAEREVTLAEKAGFRVNPQLKADIRNLPD